MRIVRTLWSRDTKILSEIPTKPLENELVLTFETENFNFLKSLNYEVYQVDERLKVKDFYLNKLVLLNEIAKEEDFIFLDWDIKISNLDLLKKLSYKRIHNVPLYSYPPNYYNDIKNANAYSEWFFNHERWVKESNAWQLVDESTILPCFCCITNKKDESIISELLDIGNKMNFNSCSEEFSFFYFIKNNYLVNSLDEYIQKIEPLFMHGRETNYVHNFLNYSYNTLNSYIEKKIQKTLILKHL